ncbi:MAG: iron-containing alcohol dehydrogenase [Balneolales bacterium]
MFSFDVHISTRMLFGADQVDKFSTHVASLGKRVFLVIGKSAAKSLGYLDVVQQQFEKVDLDVQVFQGIGPNPLSKTINEAAEQARQFDADIVVALGGGSVMDASKCIAALVKTGEKDIWPFALGQPEVGKLTGALPIAAIPTTAATASEVTPNAVVSNADIKGKAPVTAKFLKPVVCWLNPEFSVNLHEKTTQDGASDILSHVFENYLLGGNSSPLADRYSEGIIDTVMKTLPQLLRCPDHVSLRGDMLWASCLALNGLQQAGRKPSQFILHAMEHALSGFYPELSHGRGLATLYPAYFRWLLENNIAQDRFNQLSNRIFNLDLADPAFTGLSFIEGFEDWLKTNDMYQSLSDLGITEQYFSEIAEYAIQTYGKNGGQKTLGPLALKDIINIFLATEKQAQTKV